MAEGHETRRSEDANESTRARAPRAVAFDAVSAPPTPSVMTLPYYKPPAPQARRRRASRGLMLESVGAAESAPARPLPDAAVASYGAPVMLEVVIGEDDRVRVAESDVKRNPFRQICALRIKSKTGKLFVGTAWLVGPRALATAGHCVYMHREGGWAEHIDVIPGKVGADEPLQSLRATRFRSVDGWVDGKLQSRDYGVILLDGTSPGEELGWFEVAAEPSSELTGAVANISGYPADRDNAEFQYFHARPLTDVKPDLLEYDIDTFGGQSGSPIWIDRGGSVVTVGIHTNGAVSGNSGTRITEPIIDNISSWREEA